MTKKGKEKKIPSISDAEWMVMDVVWEQGEADSSTVIERLESLQDWNPKTVQTLLR
ncbi:MAG: BlaI/MecI/CopY family transcriptional regulator, partial [Verrucomicrobiota bacterium]